MAWYPDVGDLIWLDFDPQTGREQKGRRPALVLSPCGYNRVSGLAVVCPVTSRIKGYPFEIRLPDTLSGVRGAILTDQIRNLDWRKRNAEFIARIPSTTLIAVKQRLAPLLGFQ